MFKLHIYNPEHDIVLGKNDVSFTPPKAARLTREQFCHIPSFWAEDGDWVLVEDVICAENNLRNAERKCAKVKFVTFDDLRKLTMKEMPSKVEPWGWDIHIVHRLVKCNPLFMSLVPSNEQLDEIRRMSSREFAAKEMLPLIVARNDAFIGEARTFNGTIMELEEIVKNNGSIVLKSPWSCSGRGVKFIEKELSESEKGWVKNVLDEQGTIMIEPTYNKVLDFAMEFMVDEEYKTSYTGMNIFSTKNGAYLQNNNENEENKTKEIGKYIDVSLLYIIRDSIIEITSKHFHGKYTGPFGIDMMIVVDAENKTKVHPCVEMNLRRTMGQI